MRISMITQGVSPHQIPLARRLASAIGEKNILYISVSGKNPERDSLGWRQCRYSWVREPRLYPEHQNVAQQWECESDVLLTSVRDVPLFQRRCAEGKWTFYFSERWFKPWIGKGRLCNPRFLKMAQAFRRAGQDTHLYYLPIGPYAARDMLSVASFQGRMRRWGYFVEPASITRAIPGCDNSRHNSPLKVLWAGRFIPWKRADCMIGAFGAFIKTGRKGVLTLLGCGPEEQALRQHACRLGIDKAVIFQEPIPIGEVRQKMREANVLAVTSNGYEGWGAVVSEAMEEGCAVVAARECGAGASLVQHGTNGLLFRSGCVKELTRCLCLLHDNPDLRSRLAEQGRKTMRDLWGAEVAAARFVAVADALLRGVEPPDFDRGPMSLISRAETTWAV